MINHNKSTFLGLMFLTFLILNFSASSAYSAPVPGVRVNEGQYLIYGFETTATYRLYATGDRYYKITITDNETYPVRGTLEIVVKDGDDYVLLNESAKAENVALVPYVIKVDKLAPGPENCPYYGYNNSRSLIIENWDEEHLKLNQSGLVFVDRAAEYVMQEFTYSYQEPNRINGSNMDYIRARMIYIWDIEFGILLKQQLYIDNLNDSSMDGNINMTLVDTDMWSLLTGGGIPAYPLEAVLATSIISMAIVYILTRNKGIFISKAARSNTRYLNKN